MYKKYVERIKIDKCYKSMLLNLIPIQFSNLSLLERRKKNRVYIKSLSLYSFSKQCLTKYIGGLFPQFNFSEKERHFHTKVNSDFERMQTVSWIGYVGEKKSSSSIHTQISLF